ncbi:hypothetical protein IR152_10685 [Clostridioides sp. ES-S-0108-01]|uniref:hypothetical protein n=1 Tax=Clostridioides sp. ES-S-0108-01 TaxID=2770773 RepID=UPI001D0C0D2E|nr:hypothetical protein [Clostridioides sp. ES-S-0108-01]
MKDTSKKIFEEIKKEIEILDKCKKHEFEMISFGKYKCLNCDCTVNGNFVAAYRQGYEHGLNVIK